MPTPAKSQLSPPTFSFKRCFLILFQSERTVRFRMPLEVSQQSIFHSIFHSLLHPFTLRHPSSLLISTLSAVLPSRPHHSATAGRPFARPRAAGVSCGPWNGDEAGENGDLGLDVLPRAGDASVSRRRKVLSRRRRCPVPL